MRLSDAQSTVRVAMAELAVGVVIGGAHECKEEGYPLTDRQLRLFLRNALMDYASHMEAAQNMLALDDSLFADREGGSPSSTGDPSNN